MFHYLSDPLQFEFFVRALIVGALLGTACGVLGCFVVLRGMAFAGDALAHAVLPGIVVAFLWGLNLLIGAGIAAIATAFAISTLSGTGRVRDDTAIGIAFTSAFAFGIALLSRLHAYTQLNHILLGNILGTSQADVWMALAMMIAVILGVGLCYRELLISSFDPLHARALGWNLRRIHLGLMTLLALVVVVGIQAVGVILITALLITPATTARLFSSRLPVMLVLAAVFGGAASLVGLYASYYANIASGAAIVLTSTAGFLLALAITSLRRLPATVARATERAAQTF